MKTFTVDETIEKAYAIHCEADDYSEIEFIICSSDNNVLRIDCIKDGSIQNNCSSAWLGSYDAFREFQRIRTSIPKKKPAEITDSAFENVVRGGTDDSVGIFLGLFRRKGKEWYFEAIKEPVKGNIADESVNDVKILSSHIFKQEVQGRYNLLSCSESCWGKIRPFIINKFPSLCFCFIICILPYICRIFSNSIIYI